MSETFDKCLRLLINVLPFDRCLGSFDKFLETFDRCLKTSNKCLEIFDKLGSYAVPSHRKVPFEPPFYML